MKKFASLACVVVMILTICAQSSKKRQRVKLLESRIDTLESRLNMKAVQKDEELDQIINNISNMKITIGNLYDLLDKTGMIGSTDGNTNYDYRILYKHFTSLITMAFKDEKHSLRNTVDSVNTQLVKFKKQLKQCKLDDINSIEKEVSNMRREFEDQLQSLRADVDIMQKGFDVTRNELNSKINSHECKIKKCLDTMKDGQLTNPKCGMTEEAGEGTDPELAITCPEDWSLYENFYYRLYEEDRYSYSEARSRCAAVGANLVDILDETEGDFVTELVKNQTNKFTNYVIGLKRTRTQWVWDRTGAEATYTNWYPGLPSDSSKECALVLARDGHYSDGFWFAVSCTQDFLPEYFVCKKAAWTV